MDAWAASEFDDHEQVHVFTDAGSGLRSIVAVHSTHLGPAVGGTRFLPYESEQAALEDALRLSRAMSYKCALAGLPMGGGKAVILGSAAAPKSEAMLRAYGRALNGIGTVFSTAEDVGIGVSDCDVIREETPFVGGTTRGAGDPSVHTAEGVLHGLRAVAERALGRQGLAGVTIAVQGLGAVGWALAQRLHEAGAALWVADVRRERTQAATLQFGAMVAPCEDIHRMPADIFAPCALGGVITVRTASELTARAVAGAANNQLSTPRAGEVLAERGILYAPDFVINAGGVISGADDIAAMPGRPSARTGSGAERLEGIYARLLAIFARSSSEGRTPEATATVMARELIGRA